MAKTEQAHTRTYKGNEVAAREECLRAYAGLRGIDVSKAKKLKALDLTVEKAILDAQGNPAKPLRCTDCGMPIAEEDTFCPFCGGDVSVNGDGGWDAYKAAQGADDEAEENDEPQEERAAEGQAAEGQAETPAPEPEPEPEPESEPEPEPEPVKKNKGNKPAEPAKGEGKEDAVAAKDKKDKDLSLKERVARIVELEAGLRKAGGEGAWDLGRELYSIHETQKFTDGGFPAFRDFCEAPVAKGGVGISYAQAMNYIRVFQVPGGRELAGRVGVMKIAMLANAPENVKTKLLKAASDGSVPAEKLGKREIQEKVKEARAALREDGASPRGRPPKSKFAALLELRRRTAKLVDGVATFKLDDQVTLEVAVDLKDKKVSVQGIAPE